VFIRGKVSEDNISGRVSEGKDLPVKGSLRMKTSQEMGISMDRCTRERTL
jgi:hypothetical protein